MRYRITGIDYQCVILMLLGGFFSVSGLDGKCFGSIMLCFSAEIPEFLSEDECRVVMQLAQLKGLMESQLMVQDGQEELAKELNLSPEEIFSLLDIDQDGQLQLHEVRVCLWILSTWFRVG